MTSLQKQTVSLLATLPVAVAVTATSEVCAALTKHHQYVLIFGLCMVDIALVTRY